MNSPSNTPILVIDDEPDLCTLYELTLLREGYRVDTATSLAQAFAHLKNSTFAAVICDMRLPDGMGTEVLHFLREQQRPERCIMVTAYSSAESAVEALKAGAFDYLSKPIDLKQFRQVVAAAIRFDEGQTTAPTPLSADTHVSKPASTSPATLQQLVGESPLMLAVKERIQKVAPSMAPILIRGESGTGKELVARAIHACSHRNQGPWIAVNCSAIPEHLLEAEFFGSKKGAYTGATEDRSGFFQAANKGTLFLDEIGDLPAAMQAKLLRAIQERRIRPLGSPHEEVVDVRIISATHKDLSQAVQDGLFRQDLFYRLNVIDITIPPLRERREDIPLLCEALMARIAAEAGMPQAPQLSATARFTLGQLELRGNVRELENLLHRAIALAGWDATEIDLDTETSATPDHRSAPPRAEASAVQALPTDLQGYLDGLERQILIRALEESRFNRTLAAQKLGISLRQIRYRMDRLAILAPGSGDDTAR